MDQCLKLFPAADNLPGLKQSLRQEKQGETIFSFIKCVIKKYRSGDVTGAVFKSIQLPYCTIILVEEDAPPAFTLRIYIPLSTVPSKLHVYECDPAGYCAFTTLATRAPVMGCSLTRSPWFAEPTTTSASASQRQDHGQDHQIL